MVSKDEAEQSVEEFLNKVYGAGSVGSSMLIESGRTTELAIAWSVLFDTVAHKETDDWTLAPVSRVVVVPKDGSPVHFPPTAIPLDDYLAQVAAGQREWLKG